MKMTSEELVDLTRRAFKEDFGHLVWAHWHMTLIAVVSFVVGIREGLAL